jgi:hypothetical protein
MDITTQIANSILMSMYLLVTSILIDLIKNIFDVKFYFIGIFFSYLLAMFYHSFYCFNQLWNYYKLIAEKRIMIHENKWAYYMGYGSILSFIYLYLMEKNEYMYIFYNMYMLNEITIPYFIDLKLPGKKSDYPCLNLGFLITIIKNLIYLCKFFMTKN